MMKRMIMKQLRDHHENGMHMRNRSYRCDYLYFEVSSNLLLAPR